MKKVLLIFFVLCFTVINAQQQLNIELDYTVDYLIQNKKKQSNDTLSIGFDKTGRYLWTNFKGLAEALSKEVFKNNPKASGKTKTNIIYDSESVTAYILLTVKSSNMLFSIKIDDILPSDMGNALDEDIRLESSKTEDLIEFLEKKYPVYKVFPSNEPTDFISIAVDESIKISNNTILKKFIELMLLKTGSSGNISLNLPEGLILSVHEKDNKLLEAINIDTTKKKIHLDYNFNITE